MGNPSRRPRPCAVSHCTRTAIGRALCETHRMRQRTGLTDCLVTECTDGARGTTGLCTLHRPRSCPVRFGVCECGSAFVRRSTRRRCPVCATYSPRQHVTTCRRCRSPFVAKQGPSRYCAPCRPAVERDTRHAGNARRANRLRLGPTQRVYRLRVYGRDQWKCGLCGGAVQPDLLVPHPGAPTLDHVIPIAAGGSHTYANVQLAHFLCNSRKGARVAA